MAENKPPQGSFVWNELMTRDVDGAKKFYSELLGWNPADSGMPGMDYTLFKSGDKSHAGLMAMPPEMPANVPPHWMAYIAVDDVDAAAKKVERLGGKILHGPEDVPGVGRFCTISDPAGAVVSLMTMTG